MGYTGKLREKKQAIKLRKKGLSYKEIQQKVPVSKSTLSKWCRNVILSVKQFERLRKKQLKGADRGRFIGAKNQQRARIKRTKKLLKEGKKEVGGLKKRERFLVGIALYAADGTKTGSEVAFTNSDPRMIKFMANWFQEFCEIKINELRGALWIHKNREKEKAEKFWSSLIGIPRKNFDKTYIAENKVKTKKIRKKKHKYGVFKVRFYDVNKLRKIKGWINGILTK